MSSVNIKVVDRKDNTMCTLNGVMLSCSVLQLMEQVAKESDKLKKQNYDINRMRLTFGDAKGRPLADKRQKLSQFFTKEEYTKQEITLVFKDLGKQIGWQTVFIIEYAGPIIITLILMHFQKEIYGRTFEYGLSQKLGLAMVLGHYLKRELESVFVHRFSKDTMPFFNVFKNSFHYWFLMGFMSNYFLLHPDYTAPKWIPDELHFLLLGLFCIFEFFNLMCHIVLRNLRKEGSSDRGIPQGWGFQYVSCANYYWESMAWLTFAISTQTFGAYLFWLVSTAQMFLWAKNKHKSYKAEFGTNYPKRRVMFPFFL